VTLTLLLLLPVAAALLAGRTPRRMSTAAVEQVVDLVAEVEEEQETGESSAPTAATSKLPPRRLFDEEEADDDVENPLTGRPSHLRAQDLHPTNLCRCFSSAACASIAVLALLLATAIAVMMLQRTPGAPHIVPLCPSNQAVVTATGPPSVNTPAPSGSTGQHQVSAVFPPLSLLGLPPPVVPPPPARAVDGTYRAYHTSQAGRLLGWSSSSSSSSPSMSGAASSPLRQLPSDLFGARYIMASAMNPGSRQNNHRFSLHALLALARLLRRTLVFPDRGVLSEHFDVAHLGALHPIVALSELPPGFASGSDGGCVKAMGFTNTQVLHVSRAAYDADPHQAAWYAAEGRDFSPRFLLDEFGPASPLADCSLLQMDDPYPRFRRLFGGFPSEMVSSMQLWLLDAVRLTPDLYALADQARIAIQTIHADMQQTSPAVVSPCSARGECLTAGVHWRLGDFTEGSFAKYVLPLDYVLDWTANVANAATMGAVPAPSRSAAAVAAGAAAAAAAAAAAPFLVYLSAESAHPTVSEYRARVPSNVRVLTWSDLLAHPSMHGVAAAFPSSLARLARDTNSVGMVEQLLLTDAKCFLFTPFSSFSELVLDVRATQPDHRADATSLGRAFDTGYHSNNALPYTYPPDADDAFAEGDSGKRPALPPALLRSVNRKPLVKLTGSNTGKGEADSLWTSFLTPLQ